MPTPTENVNNILDRLESVDRSLVIELICRSSELGLNNIPAFKSLLDTRDDLYRRLVIELREMGRDGFRPAIRSVPAFPKEVSNG